MLYIISWMKWVQRNSPFASVSRHVFNSSTYLKWHLDSLWATLPNSVWRFCPFHLDGSSFDILSDSFISLICRGEHGAWAAAFLGASFPAFLVHGLAAYLCQLYSCKPCFFPQALHRDCSFFIKAKQLEQVSSLSELMNQITMCEHIQPTTTSFITGFSSRIWTAKGNLIYIPFYFRGLPSVQVIHVMCIHGQHSHWTNSSFRAPQTVYELYAQCFREMLWENLFLRKWTCTQSCMRGHLRWIKFLLNILCISSHTLSPAEEWKYINSMKFIEIRSHNIARKMNECYYYYDGQCELILYTA